jgi:hypothetical protein
MNADFRQLAHMNTDNPLCLVVLRALTAVAKMRLEEIERDAAANAPRIINPLFAGPSQVGMSFSLFGDRPSVRLPPSKL